MAHICCKGGTLYEINRGLCCKDGTLYEINRGKAVIDGTFKDITFGPTTYDITVITNTSFGIRLKIGDSYVDSPESGSVYSVDPGTSVIVVGYRPTTNNYVKCYLNGEKVFECAALQPGTTTGSIPAYTFSVESDCTIEFKQTEENKDMDIYITTT